MANRFMVCSTCPVCGYQIGEADYVTYSHPIRSTGDGKNVSMIMDVIHACCSEIFRNSLRESYDNFVISRSKV